MSSSKWDSRRLRGALADLGGLPPTELVGKRGRLLEACRRSLELKILWAAFEAYEELPWGVWRADTATARAFLAWCDRNPRIIERGPPE